MNLRTDETFRKVKDDIEIDNGLMRDAWIDYKGEKWHPVLVKDRKTKIRGFEVNFSGDWGANDVVGRKKFPLAEFLEGIASNTFPPYAGLRCKRINDGQRNGRDFGQIQFTPRLKELIERIRGGEAGSLSIAPDAPSLKDEGTRTLSVEHSWDGANLSEADQTALESDTSSLSTSEREAVVKVRFGQGAFRSSLLDIAGDVCWMSSIEGKELLIASHIQPWAHSERNPEARGCPDNGLLLSSLWDAAFDAGLVTFDEEWRVISSPMLSESAKKHLGLLEEKYLPDMFRNPRRAEYLAYHRLVIFKR